MSEEAMSAKAKLKLCHEQELALRYNRLIDLIRSARYEGVPGAETVATQADATALLEEVRRSHAEADELRERVGELEEVLQRIAEYKPETHLDRRLLDPQEEEDASDLEDLEMAAAYSGALWQVQYLARSVLSRSAQTEPETRSEGEEEG